MSKKTIQTPQIDVCQFVAFVFQIGAEIIRIVPNPTSLANSLPHPKYL